MFDSKVTKRNTALGMRRSAATRSATRQHQHNTSPEIEIPSFDLGIESQSHEACIFLEDGLILIAEDIKKIDDTVATTRLFKRRATILEGRSKKRRTISEDNESNNKFGNEINASASMSLLDGKIVFSEEDFRHMDESAEKIDVVLKRDLLRLKKFYKDDLAIHLPRGVKTGERVDSTSAHPPST
ncbi:hypothetical protein Adt_32920 [Abeliophyllum distichum]|uniref:Uncharacterized protein n=1 Tax=Abeliophyllum distichum TaxID=126358 RepID=A0ABD1QVM5_9LAMI